MDVGISDGVGVGGGVGVGVAGAAEMTAAARGGLAGVDEASGTMGRGLLVGVG